jgi:uncharacterized protein YjcR
MGRRAQRCLSGRDDLARAALERKQLIVQETASIDQQVSELEAEQEKLTAAEEQLRSQVEQFRSKKAVIKAQYSAAEAQVRISEAATLVQTTFADVAGRCRPWLARSQSVRESWIFRTARRSWTGCRGRMHVRRCGPYERLPGIAGTEVRT